MIEVFYTLVFYIYSPFTLIEFMLKTIN